MNGTGKRKNSVLDNRIALKNQASLITSHKHIGSTRRS